MRGAFQILELPALHCPPEYGADQEHQHHTERNEKIKNVHNVIYGNLRCAIMRAPAGLQARVRYRRPALRELDATDARRSGPPPATISTSRSPALTVRIEEILQKGQFIGSSIFSSGMFLNSPFRRWRVVDGRRRPSP